MLNTNIAHLSTWHKHYVRYYFCSEFAKRKCWTLKKGEKERVFNRISSSIINLNKKNWITWMQLKCDAKKTVILPSDYFYLQVKALNGNKMHTGKPHSKIKISLWRNKKTLLGKIKRKSNKWSCYIRMWNNAAFTHVKYVIFFIRFGVQLIREKKKER